MIFPGWWMMANACPVAHPPPAKLASHPTPARRKPGKAAFTPADDENANREDNGKHTEECQTGTEDSLQYREGECNLNCVKVIFHVPFSGHGRKKEREKFLENCGHPPLEHNAQLLYG